MIERELVVIAGDGVGREVIPLAVQLLRRVRPDVRLHYAEAGRDHARRTGRALDPETADRIRTVGSALIGPLATEPARHNANPRLRDVLDLFATLHVFPRQGDLLVLSALPGGQGDAPPLDLWNATRLGNRVEPLLRARGARRVSIVHEGWPAFVRAVQGGLADDVQAEPVEVGQLLEEWDARLPSLSLIVASDAACGALLQHLATRYPLSGTGTLVLGEHVTVATPAHGPLDENVEWGFSDPLGAIRALEALLRYGWGYEGAADQLRHAVERALTRRRPPQHGGLHTMYEVQRAILRALEGE